MVARIYRDKYFRALDFLKAKLGLNPSFIWRSVLSARNLLNEGLQWRVGTRENIKIWEEKWLPTLLTKCVQSPVKMHWEDESVCKLIDPYTKTWNEVLIRNVFSNEESDIILRIPLSKLGSSDKQIWGHTKDVVFTVRSAYHLDVNRKRKIERESHKS